MGLDSYVFRVSKPKPLENRIYTMEEIRAKDLSCLSESEAGGRRMEDLLPYCQKAKVYVKRLNMEKIREDYHLSLEAFICHYTEAGNVEICDPEKDGLTSIVSSLVEERYTVTTEELFYLFDSQEVLYWRKNFAVSGFFQKLLGDVENCGFYKLKRKHIAAYNKMAASHDLERLPFDVPTEYAALFYHEWY